MQMGVCTDWSIVCGECLSGVEHVISLVLQGLCPTLFLLSRMLLPAVVVASSLHAENLNLALIFHVPHIVPLVAHPVLLQFPFAPPIPLPLVPTLPFHLYLGADLDYSLV